MGMLQFFWVGMICMSVFSAFSQGVFNASNSGTSVFLEVQDPAIKGGLAVKVGSPAVAAGFGSELARGAVSISMFAGRLGETLQNLKNSTAVWTGFNSASLQPGDQGTFNPVNAANGGFRLPIAVAFDGTSVVEVIFYAVTSSGSYSGWSNVGFVQPLTQAEYSANPSSIPEVFGTVSGTGQPGITNFLMVVPEASTFSLACAGILTCVAHRLFRRRSSINR